MFDMKSQNIWEKPSYGPKSLIFNIGSGAFIRHFEPNYFSDRYSNYIKSPLIVAEFDYCFDSTTNVWWGVGSYISGGLGSKEISGDINKPKEFWYDGLVGVKFYHHNKYFVTKKIDLCSGYIIGARIKRYKQTNISDVPVILKNKNSVNIAGGISLIIKYYVRKNTAIYAEGVLGYKVNLFHFGISYRLNGKFKKG